MLAIDQGTTSTRAILFDADARAVALAQRELEQHYPARGWVEHDPEQIWRDTLSVAREALGAIDPQRVAGIGITNQRETIVVWDRATGDPIHRAIVWQDRRTADECARLKSEGAESLVRDTTGLLLDPYFSATKIAWILDHVAGARERADRGELACGTIDCFLLWRLTGGVVHATDFTNAGRTSLLDIRGGCWDDELCRLFRVPESMLPEVRDNSGLFGTTAPGLFDAELPIAGMAGDQQAALFGQACFHAGMIKSTYGTGCFILVNTGSEPVDVAAAAADDARLPARRHDDLRAGRFDLRRRGSGQMAARWAGGDRRRPPDRQHGDWSARQPRSDHGPGLCRAWRAALGSRGARARSSV